MLARFDSLHEENKSSDSQENLFALEAFRKIFEGLADCLTSPRKTSEVQREKKLLMSSRLLQLDY